MSGTQHVGRKNVTLGTQRAVSEVGCRETIYSFSRWRRNPTTLLQL